MIICKPILLDLKYINVIYILYHVFPDEEAVQIDITLWIVLLPIILLITAVLLIVLPVVITKYVQFVTNLYNRLSHVFIICHFSGYVLQILYK